MISWVADHRKHHAYSDRLGDPHSPHVDHGGGWRGALRGLGHAHVGWLFNHSQRGARDRFAPDLLADPVVSFVDGTFVLWSLVGLAIPFGLGVLIGGTLAAGLEGLLWGGVARIFVLHHVTYSINSLCHFFGRRRFATERSLAQPPVARTAVLRGGLAQQPPCLSDLGHPRVGPRGDRLLGHPHLGPGARRPCVGRAAGQPGQAGGQGAGGVRPPTRPRRATIGAMGERAQATADLRHGSARARAGAGCRRCAAGLSLGEYARSLLRRLAALTAVLWPRSGRSTARGTSGLPGPGSGSACRCCSTSRRAGRGGTPAEPVRRVACVWALVSVAAVILLLTWLLTWLLAGVHEFWPAWALLGLATAGSAYSLIALHDRVLVARGRRALRARIELLTRTRRQAVGRAGRRAAAHRARPARRRAGAAGRADASAGAGRAARR